jgi:uncharacterized protein YndB with AHSA1/START domain
MEKTMEKPVVDIDTTIAADPATVWKAMTRKKTAMFPDTEIDTDWKVGHPIALSGMHQGKPFEDGGEIKAYEEGKELAFTHWSKKPGQQGQPENYHLVRYRLEPQGDKTRVTLTQFNEGKDTSIDDKMKAEFEKTFRSMLEGLKKSAEAMH